MVEKVNKNLQNYLKVELLKCKDTDSVINWSIVVKDKLECCFVQLDIAAFYPSQLYFWHKNLQ